MKGIHPMRLGAYCVELNEIRAKERDEQYLLAWQRECPKCGVPSGENCLNLTTKVHKYHPHEERLEIPVT